MQQHSVAVVGLNEIFGKVVLTESSWARGETGKGRVKVVALNLSFSSTHGWS